MRYKDLTKTLLIRKENRSINTFRIFSLALVAENDLEKRNAIILNKVIKIINGFNNYLRFFKNFYSKIYVTQRKFNWYLILLF